MHHEKWTEVSVGSKVSAADDSRYRLMSALPGRALVVLVLCIVCGAPSSAVGGDWTDKVTESVSWINGALGAGLTFEGTTGALSGAFGGVTVPVTVVPATSDSAPNGSGPSAVLSPHTSPPTLGLFESTCESSIAVEVALLHELVHAVQYLKYPDMVALYEENNCDNPCTACVERWATETVKQLLCCAATCAGGTPDGDDAASASTPGQTFADNNAPSTCPDASPTACSSCQSNHPDAEVPPDPAQTDCDPGDTPELIASILALAVVTSTVMGQVDGLPDSLLNPSTGTAVPAASMWILPPEGPNDRLITACINFNTADKKVFVNSLGSEDGTNDLNGWKFDTVETSFHPTAAASEAAAGTRFFVAGWAPRVGQVVIEEWVFDDILIGTTMPQGGAGEPKLGYSYTIRHTLIASTAQVAPLTGLAYIPATDSLLLFEEEDPHRVWKLHLSTGSLLLDIQSLPQLASMKSIWMRLIGPGHASGGGLLLTGSNWRVWETRKVFVDQATPPTPWAICMTLTSMASSISLAKPRCRRSNPLG